MSNSTTGDVKIKKVGTTITVARYTVSDLHAAIYLSKVYSKIYTVEITYGDKKWII